jgi:hypothetical protein
MSTVGTVAAWPQIRTASRLGLALLWIVWAGLAWWTAPRVDTVEQLRADAAADRIVAYQWADSFVDTSALWFAQVRFTLTGSSEPAGRLIIWRTGFGRVHYTQVDTIGPGVSGLAQPGSAGPGRQTQAQQLQAVVPRDRAGAAVPYAAGVIAAVLVLISLLILLRAPAPALGTRWFWFFVGLAPFGLGLLVWLATERPWREPEPPPLDLKTGKPKRYGGPTGLVLMLVAGIVVSILVALLRALPEGVVPSALP